MGEIGRSHGIVFQEMKCLNILTSLVLACLFQVTFSVAISDETKPLLIIHVDVVASGVHPAVCKTIYNHIIELCIYITAPC